MFYLSAQLATRSVICAARYCPHDAEPNHHLCAQHAKLAAIGVQITLHVLEQPAPDTTTHLYCDRCEQWKPDEAFNRKRDRPKRRDRRSECRACDSERRRASRTTPEARAREAETARNRRHRLKAEHHARTQARPT